MAEILSRGALIDGRYRVIRALGSGGSGGVYLVRDTSLDGRVVALKMLSAAADDGQAARRFQREFHILSRLSHPHLVAVYESGVHGRSPYFTMEYLSGRTLAQVLSSPRSVLCRSLRHEVPVLVSFLSQVCAALGYLHAQGFVHRDLKSSNLMLSGAEAGGLQAKVMDMGLAFRQEAIDLTGEQGITGTVHYMAPEQVRGSGIDHRADLYALGVVLYEILTGHLPFAGEDFATVAIQQVRGIPVPLRQHRAEIPVGLQQIVLTLLEKEPFHRYPSTEGLLAAVSALEEAGLGAVFREARPLPAPGKVSALLTPRFVGRAEELAVLRRLITETQEGRGRLLVISGEAGIGKTALLNELRAQARLMGLRVLSGTGRGLSQTPFHSLKEALQEWLGDPKAVRTIPPDVRLELARLLPELAGRKGGNDRAEMSDPLSGGESQRLWNALVRLFREQAGRRPIALLIEDVQEADEGTLAFLDHLAGHLADMPMFVCVGFRTGETSRASGMDAGDLPLLNEAGRHEVVHLPLPRLSLTEIVHLVDSMLGDRNLAETVGMRLFERAEGNPLFVVEMVKALVERGSVVRGRDGWQYLEEQDIEVPETVQQVIWRRLAGLDEGALEALRYGAVIGPTFEFETLMAVSQMAEAVLVDTLERLRQRQVIQEEPPKAIYRFAHAMLQIVLYEGIPREQRERLHREVGEALERLHEGRRREIAETLAYHFSEAREIEKAIPYLKEAGDRAGDLNAVGNALYYYERALRLIQARRMTYYTEGRGLSFYLDLLCNCGYFLSATGRWEEAYRNADIVIRLSTTEKTTPQRAKALIVIADIYWNHKEIGKAIDVACKAQKLYNKSDDREGEAFLLQMLSRYYWHKCEYDQASRCIVEAAEKYKSIGGRLNRVKSLQMQAHAHSMQGNFRKAIQYHRAVLAFCKEAQEEHYRYLSMGLLRRTYLLRGQVSLAERYALMEQAFWRKSGSKRYIAENLINLGDVYLENENLERAERQYADALEILLSLHERYKACLAYCRLAEIALRRQDLAKAVEYTRQGRVLATPNDLLRQNQTWRVMGMVKAALGQAKEAELCFKRSIAVVKGNLIYDLGCSYLEAGRFYRTIGSQQKAIRHLREAEAIFTRIGATRFARKSITELERAMEKQRQGDRKSLPRCGRKPTETGSAAEEPPRVRRPTTGRATLASPSRHDPAGERAMAVDRLHTFIAVAQTLNAILDLDALLNRAIDLLLETMKAERGLILLAEPGEDLTVRTHRARRMDDREAAQISFSLIRDAIASERPIRASDAVSDPKFIDRQSVVNYRIRSVICVPFQTRSGRTVGALYVDHRRLADAFSEEDEEFLKAFASLAAIAIGNAEEHGAWKQKALQLQQDAERRYAFGELIGSSAAMQKTYTLLSNAAEHDMSVLLTGETGVGKELAARSIHYNSARKEKPFIVQDCGAMPPGLLESELFGHRRGAYTGAVSDRAGLFEAADGGTLFLDEIGNAPLEVQSRLLRVLQEGEVRRVGETKARKVNVRVIAATNKDLQEEMRTGRFREDLFYRLYGFPIVLPPLRDRREDIPMLAAHFMKSFEEALKKEVRGIGQEAMARLLDYGWPGNVRELENEIKRAVALTPEGREIGPDMLSDRLRGRAVAGTSFVREGGSWRETMEQVERAMIRDALNQHGHNVTRTAGALGISRVALQHKMKRHGLRTHD